MRVLLAGPDYEENLSIRYLSSSLRAAGHDATLAAFNSPDDAMSVADAAQYADMVGLSMCFQSRAQEFFRLAQLIKSRNPGQWIVAGGHYASCAAEALLTNHPEIDVIVLHEGERTLVEMADAMPRLQEILPRISGIAYRDEQVVRFTSPRPTLDDLDSLPFPDRRGPIHFIAGVPTSYLMGSRGCYGSCAYCCITTLHRMAPGRRFRQRNVERIADEMAVLYHERRTRQFVFHDDNFLVPSEAFNHARLSAFEKALKKRGVEDIALVIKCRPADAHQEVLQRLKDLGLVRIFLGVESATERGLAALERRQSVEDSVRALEICADLNISAQFTLMIFNPDATLDTLRSDVKFMRRFCGNPLNFCRAEIYAGTPLERRMIALGRARGDYLAREYNLSDRVADFACRISLDLFDARCWSSGSLMQNAIGLDHTAAVVKRFCKKGKEPEICARVATWLRFVNLDTVSLLEEVLELCASLGGTNSNFERVILAIRERESATREKLLSEASGLRAELDSLRFRLRPSQLHPSSAPRYTLARQVAAAVLAVGIPATTGCRHLGCCEYAPPPLTTTTAPPVPGASQQELCSLAGTITDPSGAVLTNAKITIKNMDTGVSRRTKSNVTGQYAAKELPPGRYSIKVEAAGFSTAEKTGIALKAGDRQRADFALKIGNMGCCEYAASPLKGVETIPPVSIADQNALCTLTGTITDPSGAAIPNVTITIRNLDTELSRTTRSNETGQFATDDLHAGRYCVKAQTGGLRGFTVVKTTVIVLLAGERRREDFVMKPPIDLGCCEYAASPLKPQLEDLIEKKKPFTYTVGDRYDHATFKGIAKLVYGDSRAWVQIFEANRCVVEKPELIPSGTPILIPPRKRNIPKLIYKVMPVYPLAAAKEQIQGEVVLDVTLREDGMVERVNVIDGHPSLAEAASNAVKHWRYRPLLVQGKPIVNFVVTVSFGKKVKIE